MSSTIIFTGDWHFKQASYRKRELLAFFSFLEKKHDLHDTYLVLLGDIFDSATGIDWEFFITLYKFLSSFKGVQIVVGNHDCVLRDHSPRGPMKMLFTLPNITYLFPYWDYYASSYIKKGINIHKNRHKILVCHKDIKDINFYSDEEYAISLAALSEFHLVINGHLHVTARHGNVILPGPPFPTSFSDTCKGGYLVFDGKNIDFVETNVSIYLTHDNDLPLDGFLSPYLRRYEIIHVRTDQEFLHSRVVLHSRKREHRATPSSTASVPDFDTVLEMSNLSSREKRILRAIYGKEKIRAGY